MNEEIINKEKECATHRCSICNYITTSYNFNTELDMYEYWCPICKEFYYSDGTRRTVLGILIEG